jgi:hypothetical protein
MTNVKEMTPLQNYKLVIGLEIFWANDSPL